MLVGLLCDLGVQPSTFEWELSKVDLGAFHLHFDRRASGDTQGVHFGIHAGAVHTHDQDADAGEFAPAQAHSHAEEDHHPEHEHAHEHKEQCWTATDLRAAVAESDLSDPVKERVLTVFDHFVGAESNAIHTDAPALAFDQEGGLAACAQIVCACVGLAELGVEQIHTSKPAREPVAAAILRGYSGEEAAVQAETPNAKNGCGVGRGGILHGAL